MNSSMMIELCTYYLFEWASRWSSRPTKSSCQDEHFGSSFSHLRVSLFHTWQLSMGLTGLNANHPTSPRAVRTMALGVFTTPRTIWPESQIFFGKNITIVTKCHKPSHWESNHFQRECPRLYCQHKWPNRCHSLWRSPVQGAETSWIHSWSKRRNVCCLDPSSFGANGWQSYKRCQAHANTPAESSAFWGSWAF